MEAERLLPPLTERLPENLPEAVLRWEYEKSPAGCPMPEVPSKNQILSKIKRDIRYSFHQSFDSEQGGTYFWMTLILQPSMSCKYNSPDNGILESFFSI